jgi:hypothetical protein
VRSISTNSDDTLKVRIEQIRADIEQQTKTRIEQQLRGEYEQREQHIRNQSGKRDHMPQTQILQYL